MQSLFRTFLPLAAVAAALLGLSGCSFVQSSSPSRFYVLSADLPQGQKPLFEQSAPEAPVLVVGVVRVASFLDRPQVTVRYDGNAVSFDEFVRWAEPLSEGVTRVLRANFVTLLGAQEAALPWVRAGNRDFNLFVFLEDVQLRGDNQLETRLSFRLSDGNSGQVVKSGDFTYLTAIPKADAGTAVFASLAEVLSAQLGEFSVDIARDAASLKAAAAAAKPVEAVTPVAETKPATVGAAAETKPLVTGAAAAAE